MTPSRSLAMSIRIALYGLWGACLVVLGLSALIDGSSYLPGHPQVVRMVGLASAAAGAFVFMMGVADRLFPAAAQRLSIFVVEMGTFILFLVGLAGALVAYRGGLR